MADVVPMQLLVSIREDGGPPELRPSDMRTFLPECRKDLEPKCQKTETILDLVGQNLLSLAPIPEGMQEAADNQVVSKGVQVSRRTNAERLKLKECLLEGKGDI